MGRNLRKKLFRDLRQNWVQFFAIFIMCFMALFVLEGFDSDLSGVTASFDRYLTDTNFMDLRLISEGFSEQDLAAVENTDGVKNAELRATYIGRARIGSEDKKLEFNFIEENDISRMLLFSGTLFTRGQNGIWIDRDFAERQGIKVGDILPLTLDGASFSEPVKGIIYNPDHYYFMIDETYTEPDRGAYGYAFLDFGEYPGDDFVCDSMYVDVEGVTSQFLIDDTDIQRIKRVRENINEVLNIRSLNFVEKKDDDAFHSVTLDMEGDEVMCLVFPALFTAIALLGIMTTMTRLVAKQRTTIGTLKAIGFSSSTVIFHYMSYSVVIALLGCIFGTIAGYQTLGKMIFDTDELYYCNPYAKMAVPPTVFLMIIIITLLAALTNYLSCRKLLIKHASEILRPDTPITEGGGILEKTSLWKKLSFSSRWNIRDINRNRIRTIGAFLGTALCAMLLLIAFGMNELYGNVEDWRYHKLSPAKYTVGFTDAADYGTVYDYAQLYHGQMTEEFNTEVYNREDFLSLSLSIIDEGNLYRFQDSDGSFFELQSDGIAISYMAASDLGASLGDLVSFRVPGYNELFTGRLTKIYKVPNQQGISMTREYFESLGGRFEPNTMYTDMTVSKDLVETRAEIGSVFTRDELLEAFRLMNQSLNDQISYVMVVAVIVGVAVLYNLGMLSFTEKTREIATLKVLGFSTNKIRWILQQQNIWVTGAATIVGMIIGYCNLENIMFAIGDMDFIMHLSIMPFIYAFLSSFVISFVINMLISSMVKSIYMVEALKGVE